MRPLYLPFFSLLSLFATVALPAQCPVTVDAGDDIYLCAPPTPAQLNGTIDGNYLSFVWSPTTGMSGANTLSPTVNVSTMATYVLTARAADLNNNLIINGDFESGNAVFTSDYIYSPGDLWPEGVYDVLTNPQDDHPNFAPCPDHTSGSGNMMAVNGSATANLNVWCQTVPVMPNTQYVFSAWLSTLVSASPARLQFSINGGVIGPIFNAPAATCVWQNYFQLWNSGANSSATICIVNQNTAPSGNDFALDDIVFSPVCEVRDSVKVQVINVVAAATPPVSIIPCNGATLTLHGTGSSTGPNITYNWDTPNGNIVSGQNTLHPVVDAPGEYTLTVTFNNGFVECTKTATVNVIESPNPFSAWITQPQPLGCGSASVFVFGNSSQPAFSTYLWTPGPGSNILTGQGTPTITVNQPGEYTLLVTNTATGCTAETAVTVLAATNPPTAVATVSGPITCQQPQVNLSGAGSSTGNNITYAWNALVGGNIVTGQNTQNAAVNGPGTYVLTVTNTSNGCTAVDTAIVYSTATPPGITIAPAGVFNCTIDTLMLSATLQPASAVAAWTAAGGGSIASGGTTLTPLVTGAGTYLLLATDPATGCTATDTIVVLADLMPPAAIALPADTITCQQPSVTLSGAGSSAGPGFVYQWTAATGGNIVSGDTTLHPTVNAAATYTLLVTNTANTCIATAAVPVSADANAIVAVANAPDTLTCAATAVVLNAGGSSNISGLVYAWTTGDGTIVSGANSPTPTVGAPGTYQLLLTNPANGCTASDVAIALQNLAAPNLQIEQPDTLTCAQPQLSLQGQNTAPGNFTYAWTAANGGNIVSGDNLLTPLINAAGSYTLLATNLTTGCTATRSTTVAIETGTPVAQAAVAGPITCANPTQTLNTTGSSTGATYLYAWAGSGHFVSAPDVPNPIVDAAGTYSLTITNTANGCTATTNVDVFDDLARPPADAGPDGLLTCTDPVFLLSGNTGASGSVFLYSWQTLNGNITGNPDSVTIGANQAGTYLLTVLNTQNGCSTTDTALVTANQAIPAVVISPPAKLTCVETTAVLNTAGGQPTFSYQWQTAGGQFVSGQNSPAPVVDAPGTYTLLVTDMTNGCTAMETVAVQQDTVHPLADAGPSPTLTCTIKQAVLQGQATAGPNISVVWSAGPGGHVASGGNTPTPTVDQPGDYLLTVSNAGNGCTSTAQVTVAQNIAQPSAHAGPDDTLSCTLVNLSLLGAGTVAGTPAYTWTAGPGGNIASGANTLSPLIDAPGLYTLLITDLDNGCTATDAVQIANDATAPNAAVAVPGPLTCTTTQLALQGFGSLGANFSHTWTAAPGGNIVSGANTLTPLIDAPGVYTLIVTNTTNGCTATAQGTVNQNTTPPVVGIAPAGTITCATTAVTLAGTPAGPGFTYFWVTANGFIVSGGNTPAPVVNQPGAYTLTVTSQTNGCTASASVQVPANTAAPVISTNAPPPLTCVQVQAPVNGAVSQPAGNFTASWTSANGHFVSGQNTLTPTVDAPGTYVLLVRDLQNGCTATATATVTQNIIPPVAEAGLAPTLTCTQTQVALDGTASTGQGALSFAWSGGQIAGGANTASPSVLAPGTYTLTVTDAANGCTGTDTVTALQNTTPPVASIAPPPLRTCILDTVTLDAGASSPGANFTLNWTTTTGHFAGGQNTLMPRADAAGVYTLLITNQLNGCTAAASVSVGEDRDAPQAEAGPGATLHCNNLQTNLQGSSSTGGSLSFAWTTDTGHFISGANSPNPVVDAAGIYLLTVTDTGNGCTATDATPVSAVPLPAFTPGAEQPDCHRPRGTISFGSPSGGVPPFVYSFNDGQSFGASPVSGLLAPGTYALRVRDNNGCTATASVTLLPPAFPTVNFPQTYLIKQGDSVQLQPVTTPPAVALADWQWTPAAGLSCDDCPEPWAKPLRPTVYTLVITDQNGCTAQNTVLLRVDRDRQLYAPNIFSPDGDGTNDLFVLYGRGITEVQALRIFDRWGNQVFENENFLPNLESEGWDGNFRSKALNPGVFVWQAIIEFVDGEVEVFSGDVTIYR